MKKSILIVLFACFGVICWAQGLKTWTSGPLIWDDFQLAGPERADNPANSYISFTLIRENKTIKTKGVTYKYQDVTAAIDPMQSWVKAGWRNGQNLLKLQQEFDILQYFATRYREDFMFYTDEIINQYEHYLPVETKHKLSETVYLDQFRSALEQFRATGDASAYPVSREEFDITQYPCQIAPGASQGLFSLIYVIPTGELAQMFAPAIGLSFGYGYREGKNIFRADLALGVSGFSFAKDVPAGGPGSFLTQGSYLGLSAKYDRTLLSAGQVDLGLFAGVGYSAWKEGQLISPPTVGGFTLSEGIRMDVHLHRTFNFLAKTPQMHDTGLQFRLYADELYNAAQKKFMVIFNISAGLNIEFRKLSRS